MANGTVCPQNPLQQVWRGWHRTARDKAKEAGRHPEKSPVLNEKEKTQRKRLAPNGEASRDLGSERNGQKCIFNKIILAVCTVILPSKGTQNQSQLEATAKRNCAALTRPFWTPLLWPCELPSCLAGHFYAKLHFRELCT